MAFLNTFEDFEEFPFRKGGGYDIVSGGVGTYQISYKCFKFFFSNWSSQV